MPSNSKSSKRIIIAIDGPAGAGKSTIAKRLAKILKISYLDTGAMYRALTLKAMRNKLNLENEDSLVEMANKTKLDLKPTDSGLQIFLDKEDVSEAIRTIEVTNNTFHIAQAPRIREIMVKWQRSIGNAQSVVAEGRDIGTVVFPKATYKFYMDANVEERAKRRIKELKEKGMTVDEKKLLEEVKERDNRDYTRSVGPLKKAEDAVLIDSTFMSIDEVVNEILKHIKDK